MEQNVLGIETRKYRLVGMSELLGSQPANPDVRTAYLAAKAPEKVKVEEENEFLPETDEKGLTVFLRDPKTGALALMDYVVKGFFKEALKVCNNDVKQVASKVDNLLFVSPRMLTLAKNGELLKEADEVLERPLRCMTMQGPRVTLVASECVYAPWELEIAVSIMPNSATKTSKALTFDAIEQGLAYGRFKGLGQWRNGGYGKFECERIG